MKFMCNSPAIGITDGLSIGYQSRLAVAVGDIELGCGTGNKRKVALLVAEFSTNDGRPDILLLDEPFTGLDSFAREIFQDLWGKRQEGVLRLVSCHPDFDSMEMKSSVLISGGEIVHLHAEDAPKRWGDLKSQLN